MGNPTVVYCPYCGDKANLVDSSVVYKQSYGMIWLCEPCDAYTGCHRSSTRFKPLGTLANKKLRELRKETHKVFDPIWRKRKMSRSEAYHWLARQMEIDPKKCHVAMFDEFKCKIAITIIKNFNEENKIIS